MVPERIQVFESAEVAQLLGIPKMKVKYWTIGRPLKITPSVRARTGAVSRNLYSIDDLYRMALANQLVGDGFSMETVRKVLKEAASKALSSRRYSSLHMCRYHGARRPEEKGLHIFFTGDAESFASQSKTVMHSPTVSDVMGDRGAFFGRYLLNLTMLLDWVDERIKAEIAVTKSMEA